MKVNVHIMGRMKKLDVQKIPVLVSVEIIVSVLVGKPVLPQPLRLMEKFN